MVEALGQTGDKAPLRATTLREQAFRAMRRAILTGALVPGERLLETELAARLGVSRNPVREALARLEEQGLVRSVPNQGSHVIRLTAAQVQDALLVRAQLELLAVRLALHRPQPCKFNELSDVVARMMALATEPGPPGREAFGRMNLLDSEFHERLVACSGSPSLQRTWASSAPLDLIFAHDISVLVERLDGLAADAEKHVHLLDALRSGDDVIAEAALKAHFTETPRGGMMALDGAGRAALGW